MFSSKSLWIASCLIFVITRDLWVSGRVLHSLPADTPLRTAALSRCVESAVHWRENVDRTPGDNGTVLRLHVRPFSAGVPALVFPGKPLFNFIRRVYRCCRERVNCRRVRGIQGGLRAGRDIDFVFTPEILSLSVWRAELHVHLSNPLGLDIHPLLPFIMKNNLPTRYSVESRGAIVELRVDLLFFIQTLQEAAGSTGQTSSLANMRQTLFFFNGHSSKDKLSSEVQAEPSEVWESRNSKSLPDVDLGLVLGCTHGESRISCASSGVELLHTPFIVVYYR